MRNNGADVDPATCAPRGAGAARALRRLGGSRVRPASSARFYYVARRSRTRPAAGARIVCKAAGVDPLSPDCAAQAAAAGTAFADCCLDESDDPFLVPVVQERAWTSPVWYRPEGIAEVAGGIEFGRGNNRDTLDLTVRLAAAPPGIDLNTAPATIEVVDDDTIYRADLTSADYRTGDDGSLTIRVRANKADLSAADRVDHTVTVNLSIGTYRAAHARRWVFADNRLAPAEE